MKKLNNYQITNQQRMKIMDKTNQVVPVSQT